MFAELRQVAEPQMWHRLLEASIEEAVQQADTFIEAKIALLRGFFLRTTSDGIVGFQSGNPCSGQGVFTNLVVRG